MPVKLAAVGIALLFGLSACDTGSYTPSAHHDAEASTGSLLSGTDTGANGNGNFNDPSIRSNYSGPTGK